MSLRDYIKNQDLMKKNKVLKLKASLGKDKIHLKKLNTNFYFKVILKIINLRRIIFLTKTNIGQKVLRNI